MSRATKPLTSNELFALCEKRWNLPAWALLREARNQTGYNKRERYADALAMSMYPGRGIELIGLEFKSTRADVVRELQDPDKAEAIQQYCDKWYLVVGRKDLVGEDEVPAKWGLMIPHRGGLKIVKGAHVLEPKRWEKTFVASLLRNALKNNPQDAALKKADQDGFKRGEEALQFWQKREKEEHKKLQAVCAKFEEEAGIKLHAYMGEAFAERLGIAFKLANELGVDRQLQHAKTVADRFERIAKDLREKIQVHRAPRRIGRKQDGEPS